MGLDFDLTSFIEDMRACKPPYKCPFDDCGRVYKTFSGINSHIQSHDLATGANGGGLGAGGGGGANGEAEPRSPSPHPFFKSPIKESLVYHEAAKKVEFEAEGRMHRFSVYDALELVDRGDWEASLPQRATAPKEERTEEEDNAATPGGGGAGATGTSKGKQGPANKTKRKKGGQKGPTKAPPNLEADSANSENREMGNEKKPLKLPEAHFSPIEDYVIEDAPPMPTSYYRFIEKPSDEQDEEVEYDMDEEDVAWLDIINEKRTSEGLQGIKEDQFELLMDRLEKESYFHVQTNGKEFPSVPIDDDAICCVCMDGECSNTNVILFCDLCNLAVHQECYGVPYIPEGQWLCRRCLQSPSRSVECCLCPNKGGAFKQTDDGRWAHVVCGLWIPEVRFANTVFLEPIDSIDNIPPARWKLSCRVCKQRGVGACIQCHKTNCYTAFHVTCGLLAGLHMKMDTVRESSANGLSVTVRKTAFCDVHTPQDSDCKPKLENVAALGISTPKQKANNNTPKKAQNKSPVPVLFRGLMNFSPQCPWEKVQEIASLINVQKKNQFFQRLMAYWTLKRQTRNGVPLIRRLQFAKAMRPDKAPETPQKNAHHSIKKKAVEKGLAKKAKDEFKAMLEQRKLLRRLRQDLERVRLLCELIRKREQRKRELVDNKAKVTALTCWPFIVFLRKVLESLQAIDQQEIFAEPVSIEDVPDYLDHVKKPMDFKTMWKKLNNCSYSSIDEVETDLTLMAENCLSYNERDTMFYRAGVKLRDQGGCIIRQARRAIESIGFEGVLHAAERTGPVDEQVSDDKIMKEIDEFINAEQELSDETHLKRLLELQDRAHFLNHPTAKTKRLKLLKLEIVKTRRKLNQSCKPQKEVGVPKKKTKGRETTPVSSPEVLTPGRRLRAGREDNNSAADPKKAAASGRKGKKRPRSASSEAESNVPPMKKKSAVEVAPKTPVKSGPAASPAKSPAGVNRRNAVLFTRKKQAAAAPVTDAPETNVKPKDRKAALDDDILEEQETEVQSPRPPSSTATSIAAETPKKTPPEKKPKKKRGRKPRNGDPSVIAADDDESKNEAASSPSPLPSATPRSPVSEEWQTTKVTSASFQQYRRGGDVGETDEDTHSESATDALALSSEEDDDEEDTVGDSDDDDSDSSAAGRGPSAALRIPLEPLDLVWAKCRGYPWYPALIINPKMPRTGYLHNGVPIPVPPQEVLDMASTHASPHYLILFFDAKRTWQWLTRDKLEPLGVDSELDKAKLVQSKKPSERKAVKKAYEDAILHRCRVTGENANIGGDGGSSHGEEDDTEMEDKDGQ